MMFGASSAATRLGVGGEPLKPAPFGIEIRTRRPIAVRQIETAHQQTIDSGLDVAAVSVVGIAGDGPRRVSTVAILARGTDPTLPVFSETNVKPSFLRTTAAKKPRTDCCCQLVAVMMAAIVAPLGCLSRVRTASCLVPLRVEPA